MQPRVCRIKHDKTLLKVQKNCSDGKSLDVCWFWLHSVWFNRLGKQLDWQELLFAWWLISDQQMRSHWGKRVKAFFFFSSTVKYSNLFMSLFFTFSNSDGFLAQFSSLAHTSRTPSSITTLSFLPLTLSASHCISPYYLLCLSTLPSMPASPLSPSFPPCPPALLLWKRALSAGLNGAGPLEARTMGPSSEGSRVHERGTKTPLPKRGPLCTSHHHINSLHWPCMLCVLEFVCVCVWEGVSECVLEKDTCVFLPV